MRPSESKVSEKERANNENPGPGKWATLSLKSCESCERLPLA